MVLLICIIIHSEYDYNLEKVARVWNHGSVIRSWLMELTESLLMRFSSTDQDKYGEKVIASLRNEFGGHAIPIRKGD